MVETIRDVEQALGTGLKVPTDSEIKTKEIVRKKLVASRNLTAGLCVAPKDVCLKRAAVGLPPAEITAIQGRRLKTALDKDEPFTEDILE